MHPPSHIRHFGAIVRNIEKLLTRAALMSGTKSSQYRSGSADNERVFFGGSVVDMGGFFSWLDEALPG